MIKKLNIFLLVIISSCMLASCQDNLLKGTNDTEPYLLSLEGIILNIPNKTNLELALFELNDKNMPSKLLATSNYQGNGGVLPFKLIFDINRVEYSSAIELRGRLTQSGKLLGYLLPWYKKQLTKQSIKGIVLEYVD